ncbi:hypothetical protein BLA29_014702 [Euroglyphus maynei]|uniref:Uncharacterized protein n=1 Tax=Euroglyphus maynei TaxID=6958 RepID=A0A1Y3ATH0_EURMA|nr:hypothetical protein BLA29_014702 [Euroglyphus maynei]
MQKRKFYKKVITILKRLHRIPIRMLKNYWQQLKN